MDKPQLFLLDGHALCYRAFYAVRDLSNSKGQATNAIFGFINILKKILKKYDPQYVAICFDSPTKTRRQEKYAEYKIQRESMPDDLRSQIPIIKKVIEAYNIPIFMKDGYEADDVIATLANETVDQMDIVIVSDDKDMYQLVNESIKMYSSRKDAILGVAETKERFGVRPDQIGDLLALMGDKSDNIPGVTGIGEVTAKKLLQEFEHVEDILARPDRISSNKTREKIENQIDQAKLSKELTQLELDVPLEYTLESLKRKEINQSNLISIFKECEFSRWLSEINIKDDNRVLELEKIHVGLFSSKKDVEVFRGYLIKSKQCSLWADEQKTYLAIDEYILHGDYDDLIHFQDIFENPEILKVVYDTKSWQKTLLKLNISLNNVFDILLAGYVLVSGKNNLELPSLVWAFCEKTINQDANNISAIHAFWLYKLKTPMKLALQNEEKLHELYHNLEWPLSNVLFQMETNGVCVNKKELKTLSIECSKKIDQLRAKLFDLAGEEFNLNSPKQLSVILFEKLGLPPIKKTKTGYSTNEEVLQRLAPMHDLPSLILEYRQVAKLQSTYIDALPKLINSETGRIHALFNQTGAETGRLSSSHPNLQNIPIRTELGREIRKAFVASSPKHCLISADYSQIELRVLAHLSQDEQLMRAFLENQDIHNYTAKLIFDCDEEELDYSKRDTAKRVNFGIVYGISAFGLAKDLKVSQPEAQSFIDLYFERYPKVKSFMRNCIKQTKRDGYIQTLMYRRRYIPDINNRNATIRHFAERQAINTPVQGTAADLIKLAMIKIQEKILEHGFLSKLTITVHDELVFDALKDEKDRLIPIIKEEMEQAIKLDVPIQASIKVGDNWRDMEKEG